VDRVDQRQGGQRPPAVPTRGGTGERDSAASIVAFELWYGVAKSQHKESNTARLDAFFAGPLEWTLFDEEDARAAGTIRAELEAIGKPIGAYDVLLAGQARRHGATLVTFQHQGVRAGDESEVGGLGGFSPLSAPHRWTDLRGSLIGHHPPSSSGMALTRRL
jgi:predicted nucleic acid-binding protein